MNFLRKLQRTVRQNWGVSILIGLVSVLVLVNISFSTQFLGWDNFSISQNLLLNASRVLSSWREYRGFGVQSDSESVDIFRTLLQLVLDLALPSTLVEQVYTLTLFGTGVIFTFFLIRLLLQQQERWSSFQIQLASLLGALFYGFNLHALETFFFPMAMYTARFAFLPLFLWSFFRIFWSRKNRISDAIWFIVATALLSTSFLTATLFFTYLAILFAISVAHPKKWKKSIFLILSFVLLNSYWLFAFVQYASSKSSILPLASSFVEVNEALLNKPLENFSFEKLLTFYPETLNENALPFTQLESGERYFVHPLVGLRGIGRALLVAPLLIVLIGLSYALYHSISKKKNYWWVVFLFFGSLFVLRRELPPFGQLYALVENVIPLFEVVFRFAGTKFYPLLLIAEVILFALGIGFIVRRFEHVPKVPERVLRMSLVAVVALVLTFPFLTYFFGRHTSAIVQVTLPSAYQKIAQQIVAENPQGRVLYLPFDQFSYWRSHTWGYIGSSFVNFMLPNPLLDRTFEPASQALDFFNISALRLATVGQQPAQAEIMRSLLQKSGVQYIIYDESVSQEMTARGLRAWGVFHSEEFAEVIQELSNARYIQELQSEPIGEVTQLLEQVIAPQLTLYEVVGSTSTFQSLTDATVVDPTLENAFIDPLLVSGDFIQYPESKSFRVYPFWQPDKGVEIVDEVVQMELPARSASEYTVNVPETDSHLYNIFVEKTETELLVTLQPQLLPFLSDNSLSPSRTAVFELPVLAEEANTQTSSFLQNGSQVPFAEAGGVRVKVGESILLVPPLSQLQAEKQYIGSVLGGTSVGVTLYSEFYRDGVPAGGVAYAANPNCFDDKKPGYQHTLKQNERTAVVETQSGMTCLVAPLIVREPIADEQLVEVSFQYAAETLEDTASESTQETPLALAAATRKYVNTLTKYNPLSACVYEPSSGRCLNYRQLLRNPQELTRVTIQAEQLTRDQNVQLLVVVPAEAGEKTTATLSDIRYSSFVPQDTQLLEFPSQDAQTQTVQVPQDERLLLSYPIPLGAESFYVNPRLDSFDSYLGACESGRGFRATVAEGGGAPLSYIENCHQGLFYQLRYSPDLLYLWRTSYSVQAGKQPRFILKGQSEYHNEFLNRFSGYPQFEGFHALSAPGGITAFFAERSARELLETVPLVQAHTTLFSGKAPAAEEIMTFEINQHAEGQGVMIVQDTAVMPLPSSWQDISVDVGDPEQRFGTMEIVEQKRIWPSMWQVRVRPTGEGAEQYLLQFGQAYDEPWGVYKTGSVWQALLGLSKLPAQHVRLNGWSNGWVIDGEELAEGEVVVTVLYGVERLVILGWVVTLITVGVVVLASKKGKKLGRIEQVLEKVRERLWGRR